jgi:hypothetical protein
MPSTAPSRLQEFLEGGWKVCCSSQLRTCLVRDGAVQMRIQMVDSFASPLDSVASEVEASVVRGSIRIHVLVSITLRLCRANL